MSRVCELTGKRGNVAHKVSHSNRKSLRVQNVNLRTKRVWCEAEKRFIRLSLSARALRTLARKGLDRFLQEEGLSLKNL